MNQNIHRPDVSWHLIWRNQSCKYKAILQTKFPDFGDELLSKDSIANKKKFCIRLISTDLLRRLEPGSGIAPGRLRAERAVEILERIGTPAARTILETMQKSKTDTTR